MIVLGLDTTLDACSAAMVRGGEVLAARSEPMNKGQAERLAPMTQEVAAAAGIAFARIDRIAVACGPGSFTGVRVGLSFARALALALGKPCLGIGTLEALALERGEAGWRGAVIETPGGAYCALYRGGAAVIAPRAVERGDHVALMREAAGGAAIALAGPGATIDAAAMALRAGGLAPERYAPAPAYLRAPHVTLPSAQP